MQEALRSELNISLKDYAVSGIYIVKTSDLTYQEYSVILLVPDFGNRTHVEQMTHLLLREMGFKEIAVHQVSQPDTKVVSN